MARPRKEDLDWFKHSTRMLDDEKVQLAIAKGGFITYGVYNALLERIYASGKDYLDLADPAALKVFARRCSLRPYDVRRAIEVCASSGLISSVLWSNSVRATSEGVHRRFEEALTRRSNWREEKDNPKVFHQENTPENSHYPVIEERRVEEIREDKIRERGETTKTPAPEGSDCAEKVTKEKPETKIQLGPKGRPLRVSREELAEMVAEFGSESFVRSEGIKAGDYLQSKGETRKDSAAFMRNWLRKAQSFNRRGNGNGYGSRRPTNAEIAINETLELMAEQEQHKNGDEKP